MRVALYARVSKDDGSQDTENQMHELREFAKRNGWDVAGEYVDQATGKTADRPQLKLMFEDASKRRFDLVLFWALDRFGREGVLETLQHIRRLENYGIGWRSYTESFLDSCGPFKDAVVGLLASLAKMEREKISERTKAGLRRAKRAGKVLGRPRVDVDKSELFRLQREGLSQRKIAAATGLTATTVARALAS